MQKQKNTHPPAAKIAHRLGARDPYSEDHALRVSWYARRLARRLRLPENEIEDIRMAGLLHDIGKIRFSSKVFRNVKEHPSKSILKQIKKHPEMGKTILEGQGFPAKVIDYVYSHHEREDGTGYPRGITGGNIPLGAKIIGIADTFDALITDRPYQKKRSLKEAFLVLRKLSLSSFDPVLVETFITEITINGL
ncbi:MAG: HD domain-containing protein [Desulfomonilia bacterium]|jgi:putative nucleotidyltransferase with HDIG domain|nr:HD domain-containing protein [Desulfomonilia bacterium]